MISYLKLSFLLLLLFIDTIGFGQKVPVSKKHEADNVHHIDLYKAYQNRDDFPLSKVVESMKYIPLETKQECLLGGCYDISMTSNDI